ncbi:hypothetical protein BCR34DRAFT_361684 [Clohesyomyces aquaticus]|uniref:Nephrocystin 3-like N-terminal domain-containing protein n=1 Tax=Clohesyomyces aquaticus TaxID=1231657 RepID=A0A1Y2A6W8_9PLEO|nr:hypothetical protein BCR34DRAFT_361684 [Clohesyomyces aquaticus]
MSNGSSSAESKGRWKVWSSALGGSRKAFSEIAHRFTITSATVEGTAATNSTFADMGHGGPLMIEGVDHKTISKLLRGSDNYEKLATRIRANMRQTITHSTQIRRIQTWLGRRSDEINLDNYQRNLDKHHPGTAQWLFQDSRFRGWVASGISNSILWLVGPEGCGKSVLCSLAAKRMRQSAQRPAVVYLFLAFDQPRSEYHLATQIVLQLLNHVVEYQGGVDPEVFSALENQDSSKKLSGIYDLVRILISQCSAVYVFLDGLDEVGSVEKPGKRPQEDDKLDYVKKQLRSTLLFVASLAKSEYRTPVRLWCSSRHTPTINKWMRDMGALELQVNKQAVGADVTQYLNHHVKKSTVEAVSGSYGPEALQQVRTTAGSNFLVVSTLRSMESYTRLPLSNPRTKLSELYQERLDHLCATNSLSIRIISLVAFAKRPLMLKEVQEALAVSRKAFHDRFVVDLNTNDIQLLDGKIIQQDCTPFINVSQLDDGSHSGYLRLSHASIYYFLHGLSQSPISAIGQVHVGPNLLAEVCLKYLFQKRYENTHEDSVQDQSFLGYAAKYWHQHVDETDLDSVLLQISSSFLKSPQFLTLTRYQSLFLDRHFHYTFGDDESETKSQTVNVPQRLSTCADTKSLVKDYQYFVREWGGFLELGTTNSVASGAIEHCFWGALGKHNFLEVQGTLVEKNRSFILEMDTPGGEEEGNDVTSDYCFYERISDDGSRVAVWRMPAQPYDSFSLSFSHESDNLFIEKAATNRPLQITLCFSGNPGTSVVTKLLPDTARRKLLA